jgi:hypothetical protein
MDRRRYKWTPGSGREEKYLIDTNEFDRVVAIVAKGTDELVPDEKKEGEMEAAYWWGVYGPFRRKHISQHLTEKDATEYAEHHLARGEREERIEWES